MEGRLIGSPSNLELLLHCYYSPEPHPRSDAPAIIEGKAYLAEHDMIEMRDGIWRATDKGAAFVQHLMTIPFPEVRWVIPSAKQQTETPQ